MINNKYFEIIAIYPDEEMDMEDIDNCDYLSVMVNSGAAKKFRKIIRPKDITSINELTNNRDFVILETKTGSIICYGSYDYWKSTLILLSQNQNYLLN